MFQDHCFTEVNLDIVCSFVHKIYFYMFDNIQSKIKKERKVGRKEGRKEKKERRKEGREGGREEGKETPSHGKLTLIWKRWWLSI